MRCLRLRDSMMLDALRLAGLCLLFLRLPVLQLAVEHVAHGENGLEGVSLRPARRRRIGLAARHADAVVENGVDRLGVDADAIVLDDDLVLLDDDRDHGRDFGLLATVEGVVDQLLRDHQGPIINPVPRLIYQLALGAEFHEAGHAKGDLRELGRGAPRAWAAHEPGAWALP